MKLITLSNGYKCQVDDEDFDALVQLTWNPLRGSSTVYAVNSRAGSMHRFIMKAPERLLVHHIDGRGLNNTKFNLCILTPDEHGRLHSAMAAASGDGYGRGEPRIIRCPPTS